MAPPIGPGSASQARSPRREGAAPSRPRLQVVRDGRRLRPGLIGTVVISLVFSTLFVLAFLQAVLVQGQLRLDRLDREIAERQGEKDRREVAVATAEAPQRIQEAAAANGLVAPPDVVFLERATVTPIERAGTVAVALDPVEDPAPVTSAPAQAPTATAAPNPTAPASAPSTAPAPAATPSAGAGQ